MECLNCGTPIAASDAYCGNCGSKISATKSNEELDFGYEIQDTSEEYQKKHIVTENKPELQPLPSSKRKVIPFSFGAALFFFFLPFLDLKCGGAPIATLSGIDLVVGKDIEGGGMFDEGNKETQVPPNIWALVALSSCVLGLYVFLSNQKKQLSTGRIFAIIGISALIILQITIRNSNQLESNDIQGVITIDFLSGYWGCFLSILTAGILCHLVLEEIGPDH